MSLYHVNVLLPHVALKVLLLPLHILDGLALTPVGMPGIGVMVATTALVGL